MQVLKRAYLVHTLCMEASIHTLMWGLLTWGWDWGISSSSLGYLCPKYGTYMIILAPSSTGPVPAHFQQQLLLRLNMSGLSNLQAHPSSGLAHLTISQNHWGCTSLALPMSQTTQQFQLNAGQNWAGLRLFLPMGTINITNKLMDQSYQTFFQCFRCFIQGPTKQGTIYFEQFGCLYVDPSESFRGSSLLSNRYFF